MGWARITEDTLFRQLLASYASLKLTMSKPTINASGYVVFNKPATVGNEFWEFLVDGAFGKRGDDIDRVKSVMAIQAMGDIARDGVKLFSPTVEQWQAMSQVEMRFACSDYKQPFDTLVIDVPVDVAVTGTCGTDSVPVGMKGSKMTVAVDSLVIHHAKSTAKVYVNLIQKSVGTAGRPFMPLKVDLSHKDMSVEEAINAENENGLLIYGGDNVMVIDQIRCLLRPAMNACLFLANFGMKRVGRPDEAAWSHAEKQAKNSKAPAERRERNRLLARLMPEVFTIDQQIDLKEATEVPREYRDSLPTGTMPPHWRRAHWAMQAHGPNNSQRKMVFRKASFVNKHRFVGDGLDSTTTYRGPG